MFGEQEKGGQANLLKEALISWMFRNGQLKLWGKGKDSEELLGKNIDRDILLAL